MYTKMKGKLHISLLLAPSARKNIYLYLAKHTVIREKIIMSPLNVVYEKNACIASCVSIYAFFCTLYFL
jgi:hypothetical protein